MSLLNYPSWIKKNHICIFFVLCLFIGIFTLPAGATPSVNPIQGQKPLEVTFTVPGGDKCKAVKWDFGDGNVSSSGNTSHKYYVLGQYYPILKCDLPGADCTYKYDYIYVIPWASSIRSSSSGGLPTDTKINRTAEGLSTDDLKKQAMGLMALGEEKYAVEAFSDLKKIGQLDRDTLIAYGDTERNLANFSSARSLYSDALALNEDAIVLKKLADTLYKEGKKDEAIETMNRALNLSPNDPSLYSFLGQIQQKAGRNDEALKSFNSSLKLSDNQMVTWKIYADLLATQGKNSDAANAYKHAIDLGYSNYESWSRYSTILQKLGKKEEAQKAMEHAQNLKGPSASYSYSTLDDSDPSCEIGSMG